MRLSVIGRFLAACLAVPGHAAGGATRAHAAACDTAVSQAAITPLSPKTPFAERRHADHVQRFADVPADVILIGDSLAQRWPDPGFAAALSARSPVNLGVGGDLIQQVIWRLDRSTLDFSSTKRIVLIVGSNNLADGVPACAITEGIAALAARLRAKAPQAQLIVVPIPPRRRWLSRYEANRREANRQLKELASTQGFEMVALPDGFACALPWPLPCGFYHWDGVHLTEAAYAALDDALRMMNDRVP